MQSALFALQIAGSVAALAYAFKGLWLIFTGRADDLMRNVRARFGSYTRTGGFGVPIADASGFAAIGMLAYGMAQWLLILLPVYLLLLMVTA